MSEKLNNIFSHTGCLSEEMLTKYVSDKLSSAQKHEVEKHLTDCEMCSDAVEGLRLIADKNKISKITAELNWKVQQRVKKKETKIIFLQRYRTQLAVAASVVVLLGLVWFFRSNMSMKELDATSSEKIFADKFEPYQAEEVNDNAPVSESPALNASEPEISSINDGRSKTISTDKPGKDYPRSYSKAEDKEGAGYAQTLLQEETNTAAAPPAEAVARDEKIAIRKPESTSSAVDNIYSEAKADLKKNKEEEILLREAEESKQSAKPLALTTQSVPTKSKKRADAPSSQPQKASGNAAAVEEMSPPMMHPDTLVTGSITPQDADQAMQKYEQKDYAGAVEDFETTLVKDPDNSNALFYSAISYLGIGQTDKAIVNLTKVLGKRDEFFDAAQWYLSLAYIKKGDSQNARKYLTELQKNPKSKYQKQAGETLREMGK